MILREADHKIFLSRLPQVTNHLSKRGSLVLCGLDQPTIPLQSHLLCIWDQILKEMGAGSFLKDMCYLVM